MYSKKSLPVLLLCLCTFILCSNKTQAQISGTTDVCPGVNYTYYAPYYSGATYAWDSPAGGTIITQVEEKIIVRWTTSAGGDLSVRVRSIFIDEWFHSSNITVKNSSAGSLTNQTICYGADVVLNVVGEANVNFLGWQKKVNVTWVDISAAELQGVTSSNYFRAKYSAECTSEVIYSNEGYVNVTYPNGGNITATSSVTICYPPGGVVGLHWDRGSNTNLSRPSGWEWQETTSNPNASWNPLGYDGLDDATVSITDKPITVRTVCWDSFCNQDVYAYYTIQSGRAATVGNVILSANRVCGNISALGTMSVANSNGSVTWYRFDEAHNSYISIGSGTSITAPNLTATTTFRVIASVAVCGSAQQDFTVTVDPPTVAGNLFVASDQHCGNASYRPYISGQTGAIQSWQSRYSIGTSGPWSAWSPISSTNTYIDQSAGPQGNQPVTYEYQAFVKSGVCNTLSTLPLAITVKPVPSASASGVIKCSGEAVNIAIDNPNDVSGTTFSWTSAQLSGATVSNHGAGTGSLIPQALTVANSQGTVRYTIIASANGCSGAPVVADATIKPVPTVSASGETICSHESTDIWLTNPNVVSGTTYAWTSSQWSGLTVSGHYSGSGSNIDQALSVQNGVGTVRYTITPSANACSGSPLSVDVNVNPDPVLTITPPEQSIFAGSASNIELTSNAPAPRYRWSVLMSNVSGASDQAEWGTPGFIAQHLALENINAQGSAKYAVEALSAENCISQPRYVTITVVPVPVITASGNRITLRSPVVLQTAVSYTTYRWNNSAGEVIGTDAVLSTTDPGLYTVTITKDSITGASTSMPFRIRAQMDGQNMNYIITDAIQSPIVHTYEIADLTVDGVSQSIQYFDGLGRSVQSVATQASPAKHDIVQPVVYDAFGREAKKYLPFSVGDDGWYKPQNEVINPVSGDYTGIAADFYNSTSGKIADDNNKPFAATLFESSPLNRVLKQGAPGAPWQPDADLANMDDRSVKKKYEINEAHDVLFFRYDAGAGLLSLSSNTSERFYPPDQLFADKTYDEHSNEVIEYVDKEGRTVCRKVQYAVGPYDTRFYTSTYYIYDDLGNLALVLPPEAVRNLELN